MRPRPLEVKALLPLLESDWETPEELAKALITTLDEKRASSTSYIAVMQFGQGPSVFFVGMGPYPGKKSAEGAMMRHPAVTEAAARAVVPVIGAAGFDQLLKEVG